MTVFEDGLYASVKLVPQYAKALQMRVQNIIPQIDDGSHCTITYSPNRFEGNIDDLPHSDHSVLIPAEIHDLEFWEGHDNQGYLVCHLRSDHLHELNGAVVKFAPSTYPEYKPHLTLVKGEVARKAQKHLDKLRKKLVGMKLGFHKLVYEPLDM